MPEEAVRAVRFPTTVTALRAIGVKRALLIPSSFVVEIDSNRVRLVASRGLTPILEIPAVSIAAVSVGETRSRPPYPQVALAIILRVRTGSAAVDLPIVPVSDDGKRSLTWNDAEVRDLSRRLSSVLGIRATGE